MNFRERVGANMRYYRKLNNLTMKEVAAKVGLTEPTIQKYETGGIKSVDIETLEKFATALGVTSKQLTGYMDGAEEHEAHLERIAKRETKWFGVYRELSCDQQKVINDIMSAMANNSTKISKDDEEILRKLRYITDEARSRIVNQLNYEYESERKKQAHDSAS